MSKKKKILILAVVLLLGGGYVAKGMLMPPPKTHDKITGLIYLLPKEFLVNLSDGKYGKVDVALLLAPGQSDGSAAEAAAPSFRRDAGHPARRSGRPGHHHQRADRTRPPAR